MPFIIIFIIYNNCYDFYKLFTIETVMLYPRTGETLDSFLFIALTFHKCKELDMEAWMITLGSLPLLTISRGWRREAGIP